MSNNLCSTATRLTPFCPSCGDVAIRYSEYREANGDTKVLRDELVRLAWTCRCGFDVTIEARPMTTDQEYAANG